MNEINIDELLSGGFHRLSHVNRYSSIPVIRKENVAEHSWYVGFYAYAIGKDLDRRGVEIDFGKLLSRAMLHDIDESFTGDFLRVVKYSHPDLKKALDSVSTKMIYQIQDKLGIDMKNDWETAKADDIEGDIIKIVDLARVVSYAMEELRCGNTYMKPILHECRNYLASLKTEDLNPVLNQYLDAILSWLYTHCPAED